MSSKKTSSSKTSTTKSSSSKTSSTKKQSTQKTEIENEFFKILSEDELKLKIEEIQNLINKTKQEQLANLPKQVQLQPNSKHKCVECSEYLYTELIQTRSGDEASTLFCYCCNPKCPMFEKQTRSFK